MITRIPALAPLTLLIAANPLAAQEATLEQAQIESALTPVVTFRGEEETRPSIEGRMDELGIAAVSTAVFRNGQLEWANGFGEGVDTQTLFQAASLSKSVAATGIVALAMERGVSLDEDISADLAGLDLAVINPAGLPITLRQLLSHTNGASVSGFPGYAFGTNVPTTAQVIMGEDPSNTPTVVISSERQGSRSYSGGGYTIAQYWAEQVTGESFPAIMRRYVLDPVGMERSLFAAIRQEDFPRENVALAYNGDGSEVVGGWNVYPEHAAASLWTTPTEYGRYVASLMAALNGDAGAALPAEVAREVTTVVAAAYGLGIGVADIDGAIRLNHSGSNRGYKSNFMAYPATGDLIVTMTGNDNGWPMIGDVGRTANVTYGWPTSERIVRSRLPASEGELIALSGDYAMQGNGDVIIRVEPDDGKLRVTAPDGSSWNLWRVGNATWIDPDDAQEVTFLMDEDGTVTASDGNQTFVRSRS